MLEEKILFKDLSYKIVGLAMQLHTDLGHGFLEKVYENALMILLEENGLRAVQQYPIAVEYHGRIVGDYIADIVVEDTVIVELKALDKISEIHKAQTLNYLKATNFRLALLINFGRWKLEYNRLVL
jgi:GxxExxY protein